MAHAERDAYRRWLARIYERTMADYPTARWKASPNFIRGHAGQLPKWVCPILVRAESAEQYAEELEADGLSVHYIIDRDASMLQTVSEEHTAYLPNYEGAHESMWDQITHSGRPSFLIFSVAHVVGEDGKLTPEQEAASFLLIADLVRRHRIPPYPGTHVGGVILPSSLARADTHSDSYPFADLVHFLQTGELPQAPAEPEAPKEVEAEPEPKKARKK